MDDALHQDGAGRVSANGVPFFDPEAPHGSDRRLAGRVSAQGVPFFDPRRDWARVERLALSQHGVATSAQLVGVGLSSRVVRRYAQVGWLHRIHHSVYALTPRPLLKLNGLRMAAVLAFGEGAALSHRSAGALLGLIKAEAGPFEVSVSSRAGRPQRAGLRIHRTATLREQDLTVVDGIATTTAARTLLDLAEREPARRIERALDEAAALELLDVEALKEQIEHNHARTLAAGRLRRVLDSHLPGTTATWNELEERFLTLVRAAGLPRPEVQPYLDLGDGEPHIQPDFLWRAQRVIVETDGWKYHRTRDSFERDRRRDQRAAAVGFQTLRVTWRQLTDEPQRVRGTLVAAVVDRSWMELAA